MNIFLCVARECITEVPIRGSALPSVVKIYRTSEPDALASISPSVLLSFGHSCVFLACVLWGLGRNLLLDEIVLISLICRIYLYEEVCCEKVCGFFVSVVCCCCQCG